MVIQYKSNNINSILDILEIVKNGKPDFEKLLNRLKSDMTLKEFSDSEKISHLKAFQRDVKDFASILDDEVQKYIDSIFLNDRKDKFIEKFKDTDTMSKADLGRLCGVSKVFLNNHKSEYKQDSRGVWVKDFLYWVKVKNLKAFENFKKNWIDG